MSTEQIPLTSPHWENYNDAAYIGLSNEAKVHPVVNDESFRIEKRSVDQFVKTKLCPSVKNGEPCVSPLCLFAHDECELRDAPDLRKTRLCLEWKSRGECSNEGNCLYAHGEEELRSTEAFFKTKMCRFFPLGTCGRGDTCRHAHGEVELRASPQHNTYYVDEYNAMDKYLPYMLLETHQSDYISTGRSLSPTTIERLVNQQLDPNARAFVPSGNVAMPMDINSMFPSVVSSAYSNSSVNLGSLTDYLLSETSFPCQQDMMDVLRNTMQVTDAYANLSCGGFLQRVDGRKGQAKKKGGMESERKLAETEESRKREQKKEEKGDEKKPEEEKRTEKNEEKGGALLKKKSVGKINQHINLMEFVKPKLQKNKKKIPVNGQSDELFRLNNLTPIPMDFSNLQTGVRDTEAYVKCEEFTQDNSVQHRFDDNKGGSIAVERIVSIAEKCEIEEEKAICDIPAYDVATDCVESADLRDTSFEDSIASKQDMMRSYTSATCDEHNQIQQGRRTGNKIDLKKSSTLLNLTLTMKAEAEKKALNEKKRKEEEKKSLEKIKIMEERRRQMEIEKQKKLEQEQEMKKRRIDEEREQMKHKKQEKAQKQMEKELARLEKQKEKQQQALQLEYEKKMEESQCSKDKEPKEAQEFNKHSEPKQEKATLRCEDNEKIRKQIKMESEKQNKNDCLLSYSNVKWDEEVDSVSAKMLSFGAVSSNIIGRAALRAIRKIIIN